MEFYFHTVQFFSNDTRACRKEEETIKNTNRIKREVITKKNEGVEPSTRKRG